VVGTSPIYNKQIIDPVDMHDRLILPNDDAITVFFMTRYGHLFVKYKDVTFWKQEEGVYSRDPLIIDACIKVEIKRLNVWLPKSSSTDNRPYWLQRERMANLCLLIMEVAFYHAVEVSEFPGGGDDNDGEGVGGRAVGCVRLYESLVHSMTTRANVVYPENG
jgi:hypothetical protein